MFPFNVLDFFAGEIAAFFGGKQARHDPFSKGLVWLVVIAAGAFAIFG